MFYLQTPEIVSQINASCRGWHKDSVLSILHHRTGMLLDSKKLVVDYRSSFRGSSNQEEKI